MKEGTAKKDDKAADTKRTVAVLTKIVKDGPAGAHKRPLKRVERARPGGTPRAGICS